MCDRVSSRVICSDWSVGAGVERHPKAHSSRLERHSTSGMESQLSHRSEVSQPLQRESPTVSLSGDSLAASPLGMSLSVVVFQKARVRHVLICCMPLAVTCASWRMLGQSGDADWTATADVPRLGREC